jgi:predicted AAA+ superfamily ATPase
VHYSESPPPGRPVETIKPPPKFDSTKGREALDKEIEKFDIRADERHDQEEEARKKAAEDKENQVACQEARRQAESLADKPRSYRIEPDGIRVTQTDEEDQASIAKTRDWIALHCQP